jgi:hypothetical protein
MRRSGVDVTDSNRERVGCVERFGRFFQLQQQPHHLLHLSFFGAAIADERGFDFKRLVFSNL